MKNPYTSRGPIKDPKDFFGRKADIDKIFSFIGGKQPQSCSIVGERKIGKTSLLLHIKNREIYSKYLKEPFIFVFYDFQEALQKTKEDLFKEIIKKILEQVRENVQMDTEENANSEGFKELLSELKNLGYKLVLLFDEIDSVSENSNFDESFFSYLRSLIVPYDIAYVTASLKSLHELHLSGKIPNSPFFNIFELYSLVLFKKEEAVSLILEPAKNSGIMFDENRDVSFILNKVGQHPYFIQVICFHLFEKRRKSKKFAGEQLSEEDYDEITELTMRKLEDHFEYIWNHLKKEERVFIRKFILNDKLIVNEKQIKRSLIRKGILIEENQHPRISSTLFENFVKEMPIIIGRKNGKKNNGKESHTPKRYFKIVSDGILHFINKIEENLIYKIIVIAVTIFAFLGIILKTLW